MVVLVKLHDGEDLDHTGQEAGVDRSCVYWAIFNVIVSITAASLLGLWRSARLGPPCLLLATTLPVPFLVLRYGQSNCRTSFMCGLIEALAKSLVMYRP